MIEPVAGLTTVIVVAYRSAATLPRCLEAVLAMQSAVEVVVIDNASGDGSAPRLRERAAAEPRLRFIANPDNRGFAAACNQGADIARGDALLLLNPDAYVPADALVRLRAHLDAQPDTGLLGCAIVDEQGRANGPQRRREPTARRALMSLLGLDRWQRRWPSLAGIEQPEPDDTLAGTSTQPETVDAVNGSAILVRTDVFRHVGGMDEGFVLHAEDLDLCRRVRDAGWTVRRAGDVRIVHVGGVSSRSRPIWVEWQKTRSLWRYFRKHQPRAVWPLRALVAVSLVARLILRSFATQLNLLGPRKSGVDDR